MHYEENTMESHDSKHTGYGGYVMIWLILIGLTVTTVAVAGINLGEFILFTALLIAAVKSYFVITIFMHIKFDEPVFKVFILVALLTLTSVFILMSFDVFYR